MLAHRYSDAVQHSGSLPECCEEALSVIDTADIILSWIQHGHLAFEQFRPRLENEQLREEVRVLVTGATGFLGRRLVIVLKEHGYCVRAFVRKLSNIDLLKSQCVEIYFGDVGDEESLGAALKDVDIVVHAAADTSGSSKGGQTSTICGTANVIQAVEKQSIKQMIYISSCNVYGISECSAGNSVDESGPLERQPEIRGSYTFAKIKAEQIVLAAMKDNRCNVTCLRPGTIWGPGGETYTPMMGFSYGKRVFGVIGDGIFVLPLIYIDNLVSAIIKSIGNESAYGKIFNVVDTQRVSKKQYIDLVIKRLYPNAVVFNIPYRLLYAAVWAQEMVFRILGRTPLLTCYRLISSQRPIFYDTQKIARDLDWTAPVQVKQAAQAVVDYEKGLR